MQENKKAIYLGLAAAGALLGGYVIYKYWQGGSSTPDIANKLQQAKLTEVKKGENGQLDQTYFLSLLQFVGQETRQRTTDLRKSCHEQRRKHFKSKDEKAYKAVIK